ncbi:CapA family protein [Thalassotalea sp. SU-HH00458]|uniref:CapA family protein n=1 Tax=Thalassotalea sp. SU-HH00458 TaxID=3127657 RepID=UPI003102BEF6
MKLLWVITFILGSVACQASELFTIKGKILNAKGHPIDGVVISLLDTKSKTDERGNFKLTTSITEIYQLKLAHPHYYPSIQTFSHYELTPTNSASTSVNDIYLVEKQKGRVMMAFAGDVMMGRRYYKPYFGDDVLIESDDKLAGSKAIVEHIKPYMSLADYAAVNLETQIAKEKPTERAPKSVTFYSQPETLDALAWAGIDYVSLGNNHTYDYLDSGLHSTLAYLDDSALAYSGAGINEETALKAHTEIIKGIKFSMLGYVGWEGSANPTQTANYQHGGAAYGSMENIHKSVVKQVVEDRVTIVQYHGSQEYANNPTGVTEQRLKSALDAGASLAIAHHPHVTQGLELYDNKLIAYSMGNFIFDQNFSATQHSLILYVWLDDGEFHRAEIVPLYVKGYKPTPATGMHRYTVMKRLTELSKKRNTTISISGGHGVIKSHSQQLAEQEKPAGKMQLAIASNEKTIPLYQLPWNRSITHVQMPNSSVAYRLGTNLINGSDFESFALFDSPERGWLFDHSATTLNNFGASGSHSLAIKIEPKSQSNFGMQSFRRVYKASSVMTIKAKFKVETPVKINFYWQGRKNRQKLFDAFENSPKHLIRAVELSPNNDWQNVEIDFNSPRIGYKSFRVLAEMESLDGKVTKVNIDDFALIEWQSAFSKQVKPNFYNILSYQASYLGVDKNVSKPIILTF